MLTEVSNNGVLNGTPSKMKDIVSQRSEIMQEIVSDRPGFLIRWGNIFFLLVFILIVIACWFIRYPETINASAKLTSINAPKPVLSLVDGKLIKLRVSEDQIVYKGEILGYIESTANHEEVLKIESKLDSFQVLLNNERTDQLHQYFNFTPIQLGELQTAYQTFSQASLSFDNYLSDGFYLKKKTMLLRDRTNLQKLNKTLIEQKELLEQDISLSQKTFSANELLKNEKVISDFDYRLEKSKLINKKLTLPQINVALLTNENLQTEKEKEIMELENLINQQKLVFQQAINTFRSQVQEWKRNYILMAPVSGKVAFASFIQQDQQLQRDQTICFINPENSQYFAEIVIPQSNFGKVRVGQHVLLRFQSYSYQEYGSVIGKIEFISHIPSEKGYLAKVIFMNGLNTTHGKQVQYREGLLASAEIITDDMRLLERFYYSIVRQVKR